MYKPEEDSLFFAEFLQDYFNKLKNKNISYLDMGTGSGIISEKARKSGIKNILAADIDQDAVKLCREKKINSVKSNLFSEIKEKFDLITFNAPYLPEDKYDKEKDTSGGKKGDEISLKFLNQAKMHLKENGIIFLLISSITPLKEINKFNPEIVARKKLFFEELMILKFS